MGGSWWHTYAETFFWKKYFFIFFKFKKIKNYFFSSEKSFSMLPMVRWRLVVTFATFDRNPQIWPKPPKTPVLGGVKFGQISTPWRGVKFGSKVPKVAARAPLAILFFWMPKVNQSLIRGGYPNTPPLGGVLDTPPLLAKFGVFSKKPQFVEICEI